MNIVEALHSEEARLERQLSAIKSAIAALNGGGTAVAFPGDVGSPNGTSAKRTSAKRTMSAAVRAKIARSAKARWAKIRAEQSKKAKSQA
jgi:hypothetical protein